MIKRPWVVDTPTGIACAWASEEEAAELATKAGGTLTGETAGYPFSPRLDDGDGWGDGMFPSFCLRPRQCSKQGGSCANPHGRSCTS